MANITAADVNKLRQQTGAGMMDCKNALVESDGDFEKAVDILRKKGQKVASKRLDRAVNEGKVIARADDSNSYAVIIMLGCETDFVAKNEEFITLANSISDIALNARPKTIEDLKNHSLNGRTINENITDLIGKTGEKMELADYQYIESPKVFTYNHMTGKLAAIVGFNKQDVPEQLGKEVVMQIAAMAPVAIDKDEVDPKIIEREMEIGKEQARQEGKPENMLDKIAQGKVSKFLKESTLLNQEFVRDNKKTVRQYIQEADKDLTVAVFKRVSFS
jgi:elongation factor Ts